LIDDVIATAVRITKPDGKVGYVGSILAKAKDVAVGNDTLLVLEVHHEIARLFETGFGTIAQRADAPPLSVASALLLQVRDARPVAVEELHRLSGTTAPLKKFVSRMEGRFERRDPCDSCGAVHADPPESRP
jgi:hypothetical protein